MFESLKGQNYKDYDVTAQGQDLNIFMNRNSG